MYGGYEYDFDDVRERENECLHLMAASVAVGCFLFGMYSKMLGVLIADLIEKWYNYNVFCCIRYGGKYGGFI